MVELEFFIVMITVLDQFDMYGKMIKKACFDRLFWFLRAGLVDF